MTATTAGTPTSPSVRRPPAPTEHLATVTHLVSPDERPAPVPLAYVQGTLALDLGCLPPSPTTPDLHVVPGEDSPEQREVQAWAARFAQATVEVLGGDRPVSQLLRWTSGRVYADLERRSRIIARATVPAPQRRRTVRPQVRSVHVFRPGPGSAEVSVHVQYGQRSRAIAARLERREDRWRCMALQLG
jgi:hypothetical protein